MTDIAVRRMQFDIPEDLDPFADTNDLPGFCNAAALSLTLPHLEPYLIRTMRDALPVIADPALADDVRAFSGQEGQHYRAHAQFNRWILSKLPAEHARHIEGIEAAMRADYERFSETKPLRFNLAYAEGFEAMTCSFAVTMLDTGMIPSRPAAWHDLFEWHLAEEIEHRTVAFEAFDHVVGSYGYRIVFGTWAQFHFLRYTGRFFAGLMRARGEQPGRYASPVIKGALPRYLRTLLPSYHPRKMVIPPGLHTLLERYGARAA